jgi:hypothetical protein
MAGKSKHTIKEPQSKQQTQDTKNYAQMSLCCLTETNPFREVIIGIVNHV